MHRASCELDLDRAGRSLDILPIGVVVVDAARRRGAAQRRARITSTGHGDVLVDEAVDGTCSCALRGREPATAVELFGPPRRVVCG